jgi:chitosanase
MRFSVRSLLVAATVASGVVVASGDVTPQQHATIDQLTSLFENSTPILQYGYCENINDGRGFTAGRAGFCSGTGEGRRASAPASGDLARMHPPKSK